MPTVFREDGFEFRIYTRDHPPPHVHVVRAGTRAKITLGAAGTEPVLESVEGMSMRDARRALEIVRANQQGLLDAWRRIHGA